VSSACVCCPEVGIFVFHFTTHKKSSVDEACPSCIYLAPHSAEAAAGRPARRLVALRLGSSGVAGDGLRQEAAVGSLDAVAAGGEEERALILAARKLPTRHTRSHSRRLKSRLSTPSVHAALTQSEGRSGFIFFIFCACARATAISPSLSPRPGRRRVIIRARRRAVLSDSPRSRCRCRS
jgi:hypothetical protein